MRGTLRIEIRVDRQALRRWHLVLAEDLRRKVPGAEVRFRFGEHPPPFRPAIDALLALERLVSRTPPEPLFDLVRSEGVPPGPEGSADVVIDCTGREDTAVAAAMPVLRASFDGAPTEDAMIGALLARRMPEIAIESVGSGATLGRATISAEAATGLGGGLDSVLSRTILLLGRVLASPDGLVPSTGRRSARRPSAAEALRFAARDLATTCARALYHLCLMAPHWRIGWRLHDGPGVFERRDLGGRPWTVLGDPGTRFFADPFPVTWKGRTCVFFEDLDHRVGKGVISAMTFDDAGPAGEAVRVLEEPWHLSYPFVISHEGSLWMVPESSLSGCVPIYRCIEFPYRWERAGTLLEKVEAADATIFRHAGRFWMTCATREGRGGYSDTLGIFHAADLLGPWEAHRLRPALIDVAAARPAGAVVVRQGRLWRPVQDCSRGYGKALALARIDRLDPGTYSQTVESRIDPGPVWPGGRLHTLNRSGRLECIDGTTYNPRIGVLRPFADARMRPRATDPHAPPPPTVDAVTDRRPHPALPVRDPALETPCLV